MNIGSDSYNNVFNRYSEMGIMNLKGNFVRKLIRSDRIVTKGQIETDGRGWSQGFKLGRALVNLKLLDYFYCIKGYSSGHNQE